jgi:hypothetical protein
MWYVLIAVIGVVILFVVVRVVMTVQRGNQLIRSIRSTSAAPGSPESLIVEWLSANPNRTKQKDMFVHFMIGAGMSEACCIDCVVGCVVHSWTPDGKPFGQLLAAEMDRYVTWDDPNGDNQMMEAQGRAKEMLIQMKNKLLSLDSP